MIHNHQQKTRFRSLTDDLCCIVVKEIKILFNLVIKKYIYLFYNTFLIALQPCLLAFLAQIRLASYNIQLSAQANLKMVDG